MGQLMQYLAMFFGSTWVMLTGINLGWASPYLPVLESDTSPIGRITSDEAFWCSVMPLIGAVPGALLCSLIVDKFGRRAILVGISPICSVCFLSMAFTSELWVLDAARFILGSMEGATYTVLPMYFGEIADPKIRGAMGSSILVGAVLGVLVINVIGPFTSIYLSSLIFSVLPLVHFFIFLWMPKSPYFLIKVDKLEEAKKNLIRLRNSPNVNDEFNDLIAAVKRQEAVTSKSAFTDLFTQRSNRKAVFIYLILAVANKFSGANPILFYTQTIFEQADGILSPTTSAIIFHGVGFTSTLFAAYMIDMFGRRPLMIGSTIGCGLSLSLMASYFTLQSMEFEMSQEMKWIPLIALISYYSIYNLGICMGPVVFLSELFPISVKGYALGAADSTSVTLGTISSKVFHELSQSYGMHVPFWLFALTCALMALMIYAFVPETKGKTLEQIQLELTCDKSKCQTKNDVVIVATVSDGKY